MDEYVIPIPMSFPPSHLYCWIFHLQLFGKSVTDVKSYSAVRLGLFRLYPGRGMVPRGWIPALEGRGSILVVNARGGRVF
jgi:hypothetical protein